MVLNFEKIDSIIEKYSGDTAAYIGMLQEINREFRYLPKEALVRISEKLGVPLSQLYTMATFYKGFNLTPKGKHEIHVCMGTACHVRGAERILERISTKLQIKPGETTKNGEYTLETVNCIGACALGPLVIMDDKQHGRLTVQKADSLLGGVYGKETD